MYKSCVLIVDDEPSVRELLHDILDDEGLESIEAVDGHDALEKLAMKPDAVLMDIRMPGSDGLTVLTEIHQRFPSLPVILMTAFGTTDLAIRAMKQGAFDYILKPFEPDDVVLTIRRALEVAYLNRQVDDLQQELGHPRLDEKTMIGGSMAMQMVFKSIGRVANTNASVLILGESGTGKELVAQEIHQHSLRANGPFIRLNCAAIPESLLESELFGHERGAFTGAIGRHVGRFELAHRGTLFLDEVGEMPTNTQVRLLRVLQEREFERVGGTETIRVDVRIIAATNRDLARHVQEGGFREDLYFRLNVVPIKLPPLRARREDIPALARHFIASFAQKFGRPTCQLTPEALTLFEQYDWPGNVRELQNISERLVIMGHGGPIAPDDLPYPIRETNVPNVNIRTGLSFQETLAQTERQLILQALQDTAWNRTAAAESLGISRRTLYGKMQEHGISQ